MEVKQPFVYIVECNDGSYYAGWTMDIKKRLDAHNGLIPGGAKYTRARRPVKLKWHLACEAKSLVQSIEQRIKHLKRIDKERLIEKGAYIDEWIADWKNSRK